MFGGFLDPNGSDADLLSDPQQLARFVWAIVHGAATLAIDGHLESMKVSPDELVRFAVEQLRTGIARRDRSTMTVAGSGSRQKGERIDSKEKPAFGEMLAESPALHRLWLGYGVARCSLF